MKNTSVMAIWGVTSSKASPRLENVTRFSNEPSVCDGWSGGPETIGSGPPNQPGRFEEWVSRPQLAASNLRSSALPRETAASSPSCADLSPAQIDSSSSLMMSRIWTKLPNRRPLEFWVGALPVI